MRQALAMDRGPRIQQRAEQHCQLSERLLAQPSQHVCADRQHHPDEPQHGTRELPSVHRLAPDE